MRRLSRRCAVLVVWTAAHAAAAVTLDLPDGAAVTTTRTEDPATARLPEGAWSDGRVPALTREGRVTRTAWRIAGAATTLGIVDMVRASLAAQGYVVRFGCETEGCGGFDFRYDAGVLPEPEMHVDLGNFHYLLAERAGPGPGLAAVMVSRSSESAFVQLTEVTPSTGDAVPERTQVLTAPEPEPAPSAVEGAPAGLVAALLRDGHAALDDLEFASGSAVLADAPYASLGALSDWLLANPRMRALVVGHTDLSGSLDANVAVSRARAAAVVARLVGRYGVARAQLDAEGAGYLAPRASNATPEGRARNRRVEVVAIGPT